MSTEYFIYTKSKEDEVTNNENAQVISISPKKNKIYILPKNIINYYISNGLFESNLMNWAKQFCNKSKNFLDIGAHTGTYSIFYADLVENVYAFEPQKMTYYALCGSVALSGYKNITCYQSGLGSDEQIGNQTLKIISNDGGGSSLHHNNSNQILREETISVNTLDSFHLSNIGFIKMDVEDNELFVLKGAYNTLKNSGFPKIIFESNNENSELFSYIRNTLGYKIITIGGSYNMFLATME
jgi:FkbM family methyltransferase